MKKKDDSPLDDFTAVIDIVADTALALRPKAKNILEVGSGGCFLSKNLMGKFPTADFTLLDIQEHMINKAKKRTACLTSGDISFIQEDMRTVKIPTRSFDVITCMTAFQFLNIVDFVDMVAKFKKWLTRRGVLVIGNFVGETNSKVSEMQTERCLQYIAETFGAERAKKLANGTPNMFTCNESIAIQMDIVRATKFFEVELLYKRYCFGAYYAIKA